MSEVKCRKCGNPVKVDKIIERTFVREKTNFNIYFITGNPKKSREVSEIIKHAIKTIKMGKEKDTNELYPLRCETAIADLGHLQNILEKGLRDKIKFFGEGE